MNYTEDKSIKNTTEHMGHEQIQLVKNIIIDAAEKELLPRFNQCTASFKTDGSFVTEADIACQERIQQALKINWPEYDFLAEELEESEQDNFFSQKSSGFWCLDPLDGTSNYASGLPYFSISLSLIKEGKTQLGFVYDPNRKELFSAQLGQGAFFNTQPLVTHSHPLPLSKAIALIDLKRLAPELQLKLINKPPYHSQRSLGSVALDWCWLAANRVQVYCHGKQRIWDYSAGLLIAQEAGCYSIGLDGQEVYQTNLEPRKVIGAVDKELFTQWHDFILAD